MAGLKRTADNVARVYEIVREMAVTYELRPGERVNEVELAARLGLSRTPLREALNRLTTEGMLSFVPNRGFYCRPLEIDEICHLFELRSGVEGTAAILACARASDEELDDLAVSWAAVAARSDTIEPAELAVLDERFHERLAELARNPELLRLLRNINARIRFVRQIAIEHLKRRTDTFAEHGAVVAALRDRNGHQARRLVEDHVVMTVNDAVDYIKEGLARIYMRRQSRS